MTNPAAAPAAPAAAPETLEGLVKAGFSRLNAENERLRGEVTLLQQKMNERVVDLPGVTPGTGKQQFSLARAIRALATRKWDDAGYEREVIAQTMKRTAQQAQLDALGGVLVPMQVAGPFIEKLYAAMVVQALGAMVLTGLTGSPVRIPAQNASASASWLTTDHDTLAESNLTFAQRAMTPKKLGSLVRIDNSLLRMDQIEGVEALVQADLAKVCGLKADLAFLMGAGGQGEPTGLFNTSGVDKTTVALGTDGGDFRAIHAQLLEGVVEDGNALVLPGSTGFCFHPKIKRKLKQERVAQFSGDVGGQYVFPPIMKDAMLAEVLGHKFGITTQLPINRTKGTSTDCSPVFFGVWSELVIGWWATLELRASDAEGNSFAKDQTAIRAILECDSAVRHPEAFAICQDARTNAITA